MAIKHTFEKFFDIRPGEGLITCLMSGYIFLIIATLMVIKPVRNSLFITTFGVSQLPYAFIAVAAVAGIFIHFYSGFAAKVRLTTLIFNTFLVSIAGFLGFWFFLLNGVENVALIYSFYVLGAIWGVVTVSQFWLLANEIFDARQARRLFSIVGVGSISGGIFGGYLTNFLAPFTGTNNLLLVCIGFLAVCIAMLFAIQKKHRNDVRSRQAGRRENYSQKKAANLSTIQIVKNSRHLKYLAGLVGISVIVANLVDYQFSATAVETIQDEDALTAFFGFWLSTLSIGSLAIQFLLTGRVLKRFGVGVSLLFLPIGILLGSIVLLITPALWAATLIKVSDGSFKQSINKAGIELLSVPIPRSIKKQAKAFIDVFVDSLATGLGGVSLIVLTAVLGLSTQQISIFVIALVALWLVLIFKVKKAYVNSFRSAIEKRALDFDKEPLQIQDAVVLQSLLKTLQTARNEKQICFILDALKNTDDKQIIPHLTRLLEHDSGDIVARCLAILRRHEVGGFLQKARDLTLHRHRGVREEAVRYELAFSENEHELLKEYLQNKDVRIRTATLMCAAREYETNSAFRASIDMPKLIMDAMNGFENGHIRDEETQSFVKMNAAEVIGIVNDPALYPLLQRLFDESASFPVLSAAISSAGKTRSPLFIERLIGFLSDKNLRSHARNALAAYGNDILEKLTKILDTPESSELTCAAVPKVMASIRTQEALNRLYSNLGHRNLLVRNEVIHALKTLKKEQPRLKFNKNIVNESLVAETTAFNDLLEQLFRREARNVGKVGGNGEAAFKKAVEARRLLYRALEEQLEHNLERIFDLLGVKYSPRDMENAYNGIRSDKTDLRANAIEFLDNYLDPKFKKLIIPLVESYPAGAGLDSAKMQHPPDDSESERKSLQKLLTGDVSWLKACALFLIAEERHANCESHVRALLKDQDKIIRETAAYAIAKLNNENMTIS